MVVWRWGGLGEGRTADTEEDGEEEAVEHIAHLEMLMLLRLDADGATLANSGEALRRSLRGWRVQAECAPRRWSSPQL